MISSSTSRMSLHILLVVKKAKQNGLTFCSNQWARNHGVAWQPNTKNAVFINIIKQLAMIYTLYKFNKTHKI